MNPSDFIQDFVLKTPSESLSSGCAPNAAAEPTTPMRQAKGENRVGMKLSELFSVDEDRKIRLASQVGITHAIVRTQPELDRVPRSRYAETLKMIKSKFEDAGMVFAGVESHPVTAEKLKLGLPGREQELENYLAVIEALSEVGVSMICYNWMAGLSWYRTSVTTRGRGGALISEFDARVANAQGPTEWGQVREEHIWHNLEYFLQAVIPLAEHCGVKMALHPDDPPLSPLRGIGRILTSADAFRRVLRSIPSPVNGLAFCQANFQLMGENIAALVREWCADKKIFFVHFRDVEGSREYFRETFHDNGPTDLARMLRLYHECGFDGPIRPDHAPTLDGETNDRPGYSMGGKVLAIGYMKGAMDALGIPYS